MNRRTLLFGALALVAVAAAVGVLWYIFIRSDAPPPVSLDDAIEAVGTTTTNPVDGAGEDDDTSSTTAIDPPDGDDTVDGDWVVDTATSFVGYRVVEELAGIGTGDAAGRTPDVAGTLTIDGASITAVDVEADMTTLASDNSTRDGQLRSRGLETDTFPTATFSLTSPIELAGIPAPAEPITATAIGDLTLHGVTNQVEIPIEGQLVDAGTIVVVGSVEITLADYDIEPPTGMRVLSIEDTGTIELQLSFLPG